MSFRHRGALFLWVLLACSFITGCATPRERAPQEIARISPRPPVYSPYQHVAMGRAQLPPAVRALTLAFATGECGVETWEGTAPDEIEDTLRALIAAGLDYIVSTGGEAGTFTCATDAGMETFIARYESPRLVGFDFDIERGQSDDVLRDLARTIGNAQARRPWLRISVTLATWAGSDGARASLNADGARVLAALRAAGVADYYVNLMVMDYGEATQRNCVVAGTVCDMGRSAMQAATNLTDRFGVPPARIELTPMIGVNDVTANVFTVDDATTLARFARERGLAGVHFWSLDRDVSCPENRRVVSSRCHGLPGLEAFAYTRAFADALR
jgi:hypothetical protein